MKLEELIALGAFIFTIVGASWKLSSEISIIKVTLEKLLTKFEQVEKIEKRVERLERKVFNLEVEEEI